MLFRSSIALVGLTFALFAVPLFGQPGKPPTSPKATKLPLTKVVLYTAGIGYFQREGTIDGPARVDLTVAEEDVNDLIKTLIAADADGKTAGSVTVDGSAPAALTLQTFAVDLTTNPSVADLLGQVRGERVQVTDKGGEVRDRVDRQRSRPRSQGNPTEHHSANGLTEHEYDDRSRHRAIGPIRARSICSPTTGSSRSRSPRSRRSSSRTSTFRPSSDRPWNCWPRPGRLGRKRSGCRSPAAASDRSGLGTWPRLRCGSRVTDCHSGRKPDRPDLGDGREHDRPTTGTNVALSLVSGRPMTFKMDLLRPAVRPPADGRPGTVRIAATAGLPRESIAGQANRPGRWNGGELVGDSVAMGPRAANFSEDSRRWLSGGNLGVGVASGRVSWRHQAGRWGCDGFDQNEFWPGRATGHFGPLPLTRSRREACLGTGSITTRFTSGWPCNRRRNRSPLPVTARPTSADFGRSFRYDIAEPVTLPRFKTALLPVMNEPVTADRVSIYNPAVLTNHPLLGHKLTNKSKQFLAQGPVAVYDGDDYAGDARLPDVQPGETRLLSFAIDRSRREVNTVIFDTTGHDHRGCRQGR